MHRPEGRGQSKRPGWALLRDTRFALFFMGNFLSNLGTWFQNIAQGLLVFRLTGSPFYVGLVNFAQFAAVPVFAPLSGRLADQYDRRRLGILAQMVAAGTAGLLSALYFLRHLTPWRLIAGAFLLGLTNAFSTPILQTVVACLVRPQDLAAALVMNSATYNLARAAGPVLAVLTVETAGFGWAFLINAVSFCVLAFALLRIRPQGQETHPAASPQPSSGTPSQASVPLLLIAAGTLSVAMDPIMTLSPAFAARVFGRPDTWAGYLVGAFGIGAIAATLRTGGMPSPRSMALHMLVLGIGGLGFALAPSGEVGLAAAGIAGYGFLYANAGTQTLLLLAAPPERVGHLMGLWSVAFLGIRPVAALADGALATLVGLRGAAVLLTFPVLGVSSWMLLHPAIPSRGHTGSRHPGGVMPQRR
ncbi:MAG: MFS transporter [Armatimonadota bacterium]|nr:MFS transporter [Armatimonadota bacterium]MDR7440456.1 MFS transporter [Armatimonadota bacterium]MDR7444606.1 MFS transporter [Armatimonadota bacterium]MDR7569432.1 MFS transporter [Armatimonadota bacterium]MDR7613685.1 MFS transporter [Armatimonadota bacterium]